jgi:hypothetical protein
MLSLRSLGYRQQVCDFYPESPFWFKNGHKYTPALLFAYSAKESS